MGLVHVMDERAREKEALQRRGTRSVVCGGFEDVLGCQENGGESTTSIYRSINRGTDLGQENNAPKAPCQEYLLVGENRIFHNAVQEDSRYTLAL